MSIAIILTTEGTVRYKPSKMAETDGDYILETCSYKNRYIKRDYWHRTLHYKDFEPEPLKYQYYDDVHNRYYFGNKKFTGFHHPA